MDPSIIKAEAWNAQGSYFALCRSGVKEQLQNSIFYPSMSYGPKNQAAGWRFGGTLIVILNHINFPELMT